MQKVITYKTVDKQIKSIQMDELTAKFGVSIKEHWLLKSHVNGIKY